MSTTMPSYPMRNFRLYFINHSYSVYAAPTMLLGVLGLTLVAGLITGSVTGLPLPAQVADGFEGVWMIVPVITGTFISSGALAVNRTFAMALTFGSTRRDFFLGLGLGFFVTSLITAVCGVVLLLLEQLTGGWFMGVPVFDVPALGSGNVGIAFVSLLVYAMAALFIGAAFGTIFRALGPTAVTVAIVVSVLAILGLAAIIVVQRDVMLPFFAGFGAWLPAAVGAGLAVVAVIVSGVANRRATI